MYHLNKILRPILRKFTCGVSSLEIPLKTGKYRLAIRDTLETAGCLERLISRICVSDVIDKLAINQSLNEFPVPHPLTNHSRFAIQANLVQGLAKLLHNPPYS